MTRDEQKYLREAKKRLDAVIKSDTKKCGFQNVNGFVYKFVGDFLYACIIYAPPVDCGKKLSATLYFKPVALDELFWEIFELKEGKTQPKSFHVRGAFTAPKVFIEEWEAPVDCIEDMDIAFRSILNQVDSAIESHHGKIGDMTQFREFVSGQKHQRLNFILAEISLGNFQTALSIVEQEISKGNSGEFLDSKGKSIFLYIKSYCEGRSQV